MKNNREIRLLAHISLEVPIEWTKGDIMYIFDMRHIKLTNREEESWNSIIDIIEIEEENELYKDE